MNESLAVKGDADMQFFAGEMQEDEITLAHCAARNRPAGCQLFPRSTRHANARAARGVYDKPAAVEAAGRSASEAIRLAEHGHGVADQKRAAARRRMRDAG